MERITLFADVILPLPVQGFFTYRVPYDLNDKLKRGIRVVVQFGKLKLYTAIVYRIHEKIPAAYVPKYVLSVLDETAIINDLQFSFWEWIYSYYMCLPGEVMNAALPSSLKLASETRILLNPDFSGDLTSLSPKELLVTEALHHQVSLTISEVSGMLDQQKVIPLIKTLVEKGIALPEEELVQRYRAKTEICVRISETYKEEEAMRPLFDELNRKAPRQLELLMSWLNLSRNFSDKHQHILRSLLVKSVNSTTTHLNALVKKGIFELYEISSSRLDAPTENAENSVIEFSEEQESAIISIHKAFDEEKTVLLHGVTSSGKTEVYIQLIKEALEKGKQVLFLLPEIALTTQIINRLRKFFSNKVGVYHSRYGANERAEVWNRVLAFRKGGEQEAFQIVLGARSALFLPFSDLGLIIVDEEHDTSYKQYDPAPRYQARDAALYLARLHGANVILGSATPCIESFHNAECDKYALVELHKRYRDILLPEILVADLKQESKQKKMKSIFSSFLLEHMEMALANHEQIILFQNRRGFSLRVECSSCFSIPQCKYCDVSLTYHKKTAVLKCHYCGYSVKTPDKCAVCGSTALIMKGFGTEKVEEELRVFLPEANIERMDLDTTRSKNSYQRIINDFEDRKIDILIGTQMVTKGLDFDHVSLVGILNADNMLNFPDFRSFERSYQLMAQVSGRAGRKNKRGKVVIQTYNPNYTIIRNVIDNDYKAMYHDQMAERRKFSYPPFCRLISLSTRHKDEQVVNEGAKVLAMGLRNLLGKRVLGPEFPIVSKIKNLFHKNILIKMEKDVSITAVKKMISEEIQKLSSSEKFKQLRVVIDVDPM